MLEFPSQEPRPFTREAVEALRPNQYGCYGILNRAGSVYIGKGNIRTRLLAHLRGDDNPLIAFFSPTHFVAAVTANADDMEWQLIQRFDPVANRRIG